MKNNKIIIIIIVAAISAVSLFLNTYFVGKNQLTQNVGLINNAQLIIDCAKEGEAIGASGMPDSCCSGLKPLGGRPDGYDGNCSLPQPPGGLSICSACGDGICNNNYEGKCNCPTDCANSVCGKEGDTLGGKIDRCCSGLKPKALSESGGMFECAK